TKRIKNKIDNKIQNIKAISYLKYPLSISQIGVKVNKNIPNFFGNLRYFKIPWKTKIDKVPHMAEFILNISNTLSLIKELSIVSTNGLIIFRMVRKIR